MVRGLLRTASGVAFGLPDALFATLERVLRSLLACRLLGVASRVSAADFPLVRRLVSAAACGDVLYAEEMSLRDGRRRPADSDGADDREVRLEQQLRLEQ